LLEISKETITASLIKSIFFEKTGKVLESDDKDGISEILAINERLGISSDGAIFGNGHYFPLNSV
jgi:hypothetical protein